MSSRLQILQKLRTCRGTGLLLGAGPGSDPGEVELHVAGVLAEAEAELGEIHTVVLRLTRPDDGAWAVRVASWLAAHGRRPVLRTACALPRSVVGAAARATATVVLELAHQDPAITRALLGVSASPPAALLLQAQHLRSMNIPVGAHIGPLLPGLHAVDRLRPLLQHVAAADVRSVHLTVGQLGQGRLDALQGCVPDNDLAGLLRAFAVTAAQREARDPQAVWRLSAGSHVALYHSARRLAQSQGLLIDDCGCSLHCQLDTDTRPSYVAVEGPELFTTVG